MISAHTHSYRGVILRNFTLFETTVYPVSKLYVNKGYTYLGILHIIFTTFSLRTLVVTLTSLIINSGADSERKLIKLALY